MSQTVDNAQALTPAIDNTPKPDPAPALANNAPTVVVISSNATAAENILAGLKPDANPEATAPLDQDAVDATDLTGEDWLKIL